MRKLNQAGFHILPVLLALIVIGAIGFAGFRVMNSKKGTSKYSAVNEQNTQSAASSFLDQYKDACQDRDVRFTDPPVPLDQIGYMEPLGKVSDGHVTPTDHVYVAPLDPNAADNTTSVTMPADGTVVEVGAMPAQYIGDRQQQTAAEDHRLVISHSCRYFSIFIHVHQLSPALRSVVGKLEANSSKRVTVDLKAGDELGKIGGNPVDWTPIDTEKTLPGFISPELYASEPWKIHTVSPFTLYRINSKFKLDVGTNLRNKSLRSKEPEGGKIDYDQKGRLIGNWFRQGSGGYSGNNKDSGGRYWDGHLSVAPDYIDGVTTIVSVGNWDGAAKQLAVKGDFNPAKISASDGPVKAELVELTRPQNGQQMIKDSPVSTGGPTVGTIMFEVQRGEKLKVEKFIGKSPSQVSGFTPAVQIYVR